MMNRSQGRGVWPVELEGSANVVKSTSTAHRTPGHDADSGFVNLMGRLTASMSDSTMAFVEDGALLGSRQRDMGNSGLQSSP